MSSQSNKPLPNHSKGLSLKSRLQSAIYSVVTGFAFRPEGTVNRRLFNYIDLKSPPSTTPINGVKSSDHTIDPSRNLWFRLFVPVNDNANNNDEQEQEQQPPVSLPVIIYFHGGGFVTFSPSTTLFDTFCRRLAGDINAVVISVNYRHSPEHRFPAQYDDGFDVLKFLDEKSDEVDNFPVNADLGKCFLAGDSAGGNIIHHMTVRIAENGSGSGSGSELFKFVRVRGLVGIQPFFGGEERTGSELHMKNVGVYLHLERTDFYWKAFLPEGSDRDHPACNVFGSNSKDISGLKFPPSLVIVGGLDVLQDWQRRYCEGMKRFGKEVELVEYPNMFHGFYSATELPEFPMLVARIGEFMDKQLQLLD